MENAPCGHLHGRACDYLRGGDGVVQEVVVDTYARAAEVEGVPETNGRVAYQQRVRHAGGADAGGVNGAAIGRGMVIMEAGTLNRGVYIGVDCAAVGRLVAAKFAGIHVQEVALHVDGAAIAHSRVVVKAAVGDSYRPVIGDQCAAVCLGRVVILKFDMVENAASVEGDRPPDRSPVADKAHIGQGDRGLGL